MRTVGSLAIVQETENDEDDRERDDGRGVNFRSLEGDLRWANWEWAETDGLKVAAVPEVVAITEFLYLSLKSQDRFFAYKILEMRVFIDSFFQKKKFMWSVLWPEKFNKIQKGISFTLIYLWITKIKRRLVRTRRCTSLGVGCVYHMPYLVLITFGDQNANSSLYFWQSNIRFFRIANNNTNLFFAGWLIIKLSFSVVYTILLKDVN